MLPEVKTDPRELRATREEILGEAIALVQLAETEERDLTQEEQDSYEGYLEQADALRNRAERIENLSGIQQQLAARQAPNQLEIGLGDTEERAWCHFIRTGDDGGLREFRASNDTTMNITTDADGGYAVPTGHFQGIVARRDEMRLSDKLGVRQIPGKGTTVNVPVDNEADGEFVSTAESGAYDRDAPAIDQKAMTLVKYTKKVDLTVELLEDEDSRLMDFLNDFVGRGMAKTHNNLLLTEVATNGTSLKTFASATAIAAGEPEDIVFQVDLAEYLDDSDSVGWVMRSPTFGDIASITGNARLYAETPGGSRNKEILGYPVHYSAKAAAVAASAKPVYFGNWFFVGLREAPNFSMIRDPYSRAGNGELILHYMFRADYAVLIAEAIGYGENPSS